MRFTSFIGRIIWAKIPHRSSLDSEQFKGMSWFRNLGNFYSSVDVIMIIDSSLTFIVIVIAIITIPQNGLLKQNFNVNARPLLQISNNLFTPSNPFSDIWNTFSQMHSSVGKVVMPDVDLYSSTNQLASYQFCIHHYQNQWEGEKEIGVLYVMSSLIKTAASSIRIWCHHLPNTRSLLQACLVEFTTLRTHLFGDDLYRFFFFACVPCAKQMVLNSKHI